MGGGAWVGFGFNKSICLNFGVVVEAVYPKPFLQPNMSSKVFREITGTVAELTFSPSIINPPTPTSGVARATYNFDVDGATIVGENPLLLDSTIPSGALINRVFVTVITPSVGPFSLSMGINSPYDIVLEQYGIDIPMWSRIGTNMNPVYINTLQTAATDLTFVSFKVTVAPHTAGNYAFRIEWST